MAEEQNQPKEGYIIDYISGTQVKASPEEVAEITSANALKLFEKGQ